MAINPNHKWLSSKEGTHELEIKQRFFEQNIGQVESIYHRNTFCSGFMADNVIAEINGAIYAVTDDWKVYKRENKQNATWQRYDYEKENDNGDIKN